MAQLLLKANDIPRLTALGGNIDIDKLTPYVFQAQTLDAKRILGTTLFEKIANDYTNDSLSGDYATIYNDYLIFIISYYSASYYIAMGGFAINNNGILKNSDTATDKNISSMAEKYRQLGITFETELLKFLLTVDLPEYTKENATKVKLINPWY